MLILILSHLYLITSLTYHNHQGHSHLYNSLLHASPLILLGRFTLLKI
jgi:hypothetical protein